VTTVSDVPLIVPFSQAWHDDMDLDGHCEMPLNADGQGPETDESKVVRIVCWCWRGRRCPMYPERTP
jgi:hypothetical protein